MVGFEKLPFLDHGKCCANLHAPFDFSGMQGVVLVVVGCVVFATTGTTAERNIMVLAIVVVATVVVVVILGTTDTIQVSWGKRKNPATCGCRGSSTLL